MKKSALYLALGLFLSNACFADDVKVQVNFRADTKYGVYADALYFTEAEWEAKPDVVAMKQTRIDQWVAFMDTAVTPKEPTKEELQKTIDLLNSEIAQTVKNRDKIQSKVEGMS